MNSEKGFESGRPRTESAREESHQSARARETTGKARPQENWEKTRAAMNAARKQLAKEADVPILAIVLPVAEQSVQPVSAEAPNAIDIAGRVVEKVIEGVIKTAKLVVNAAERIFGRCEGSAV